MYDKIVRYYNKGIYNKNHIIAFVQSGVISTEDYAKIVGETFPEDVSTEKEPTEIEKLQDEVRTLRAQTAALTESNMFLEECLVEMAEIVYA